MEIKKYRLGNKPEEYELVTKYLGWLPENFSSWNDWVSAENRQKSKILLIERLNTEEPKPLTIFSADKKESVTLLMDHSLIKDAFPMDFFGEERSKDWSLFYKVSTEENPKIQFLIPLH